MHACVSVLMFWMCLNFDCFFTSLGLAMDYVYTHTGSSILFPRGLVSRANETIFDLRSLPTQLARCQGQARYT